MKATPNRSGANTPANPSPEGTRLLRSEDTPPASPILCRHFGDQAAQEVLNEIRPEHRAYMEDCIARSGLEGAERWFRNIDWLSAQNIDPSVADYVIRNLRVYARAELQRKLAVDSFATAAATILRAQRATTGVQS